MIELNVDQYTLQCESSNSPIIELMWFKGGIRYYGADTSQFPTFALEDKSSARYRSYLQLPMNPNSIVGTYTCKAQNQFGESEKQIVIEGSNI